MRKASNSPEARKACTFIRTGHQTILLIVLLHVAGWQFPDFPLGPVRIDHNLSLFLSRHFATCRCLNRFLANSCGSFQVQLDRIGVSQFVNIVKRCVTRVRHNFCHRLIYSGQKGDDVSPASFVLAT